MPLEAGDQAESSGSREPAGSDPSPLRSRHTSNFPAILNHLHASLIVSTYQAGKLILVRPEVDALNTHFRPFNKPMGIAVAENRLAIGGAIDVWEFHNVPAAAKATEGERRPDCCYLPRRSHCTGDIQIHEMEWGYANLRDESGSPRPVLDRPRTEPHFPNRISGLSTRDFPACATGAMSTVSCPGGDLPLSAAIRPKIVAI